MGRRPVPRVADDPKWTDPGLLVMGSLAAGPKHGYAMVQDVVETTGVRLGPGTLYGAIARLEARGLIEAVDGGDSRRRPYKLTARGVEVLERQLAGMQRFAGLGRQRLTRLSPTLRGAS
jgi:DNA-binding PadR family transcriptional regulator